MSFLLKELPISGTIRLSKESPILGRYQWLHLRVPSSPDPITHEWTHKFESLTSLQLIGTMKAMEIFDSSSMCHIFSCMPHIRRLELRKFMIPSTGSAILTRCLSHLLDLISLTIHHIEGIDSLDFFDCLPHRTMKTLSLTHHYTNDDTIQYNTPCLHPTQFEQHFLSIMRWSRLEDLHMNHIFSPPLSHEMIALCDWKSSTCNREQFPYLRSIGFDQLEVVVQQLPGDTPPAPILVGVELNPGPGPGPGPGPSSTSSSEINLNLLQVSSASWLQSRDLLHSIFHYLTFSDLITTMIRVSHLWYSCAHTLPQLNPPRYRGIDRDFDIQMKMIKESAAAGVHSPFLSHITDISPPSILSASALSSTLIDIKTHFDHLSSLTLRLGRVSISLLFPVATPVRSEWMVHFQLSPPCLTKLDLGIIPSNVTLTSTLIAIMRNLSIGCPRLKSLRLKIDDVTIPRTQTGHDPLEQRLPLEMLQHLSRMPNLEDFEYILDVKIESCERLSAQFALLRTCTHLKHLLLVSEVPRQNYTVIEPDDSAYLARLKAILPPRNSAQNVLHVRELPFRSIILLRLTEESAAILNEYRWLEQLQLRIPISPIFATSPWTHNFEQLTSLQLSGETLLTEESTKIVNSASMYHAFTCMLHIRTLDLREFMIPSPGSPTLTRWLSPLLDLTSLTIDDIAGIDSLDFLHCLPHQSMKKLSLSHLPLTLPAPEFEQHFLSIPRWSRLQFLAFDCVFSPRLSDEMTDRCCYWKSIFSHEQFPYLRSIHFDDPPDNDDEEEEGSESEEERKEREKRPSSSVANTDIL